MKARPVFLVALAVTLAGAGWWWWWMRHAGDEREQRLLDTLGENRDKFDKLLRALRRAGHRVVLSFAYRSPELQAELHAKDPAGAAPPGKSKHEQRKAVDVLLIDQRGKVLPDDAQAWRDAGAIGKGLGFVWGGDFKRVYDAGHFEVA